MLGDGNQPVLTDLSPEVTGIRLGKAKGLQASHHALAGYVTLSPSQHPEDVEVAPNLEASQSHTKGGWLSTLSSS